MTYDPNAGWPEQPQQPYPQQPQQPYPQQPQQPYPQQPQQPAYPHPTPGPQGPPPGYPGGPQSPGGPPGAPPTYPPQPGGTGGPPRKSRGGLVAFITTAIVALMAIVVVSTILVVRSQGTAEAGEIFLEASDQPGPDPFSTSVKSTPVSVTTPSTAAPAPAPDAGGATVKSSNGATPGLYGGTNNLQTCDPEQVIVFLEANPDKAAAWVEALNGDSRLQWSGGTRLSVTDIRPYIGELTSVSLATDTRVTNFGYLNGRPTARQAVLQAGTAVLVDKYGVPRVKCACGNPLTPPTAQPRVHYSGPQWSNFSSTNIVVVQQSTVIINTYVLVNVENGERFERPAGTSGKDDHAVEASPGGGSSSTTKPPGSSSTSRAPTTTRPSSTTAAPTTAGTTPAPAGDICAVLKDVKNKTALLGKDTTVQQIIDIYLQLKAAAPPDLKPDMDLVVDYYVSTMRSTGQLPIDNIPANIKAADLRVEAAVKARCGE